MKGHKFSKEEREELSLNPNISKVLNSNVEYTEEFKKKVLQTQEGEWKSAKKIFQEAGIPDWLNNKEYAKSTIKRWRKASKKAEQIRRGRPKKEEGKAISEMSMEELRQRVAYLELENEFLKKLEPLEQYKNKQ